MVVPVVRILIAIFAVFAIIESVTSDVVTWAAKTDEPEAVAYRVNMRLVGPVEGLDGVYLFEHDEKERDQVSDPREDEGVEIAELQTPTERFTRATWTPPSDPGFPRQWHLLNAEGGADLNVVAAWMRNFTGAGVTVAVVDDGLEWTHPDIRPNYAMESSRDIHDGDSNPSPSSGMYHGTSCAGLVAAASNDVCGVGVAPGARVAGLRLLGGPVTDAQEATSLTYNRDTNKIYSSSWGPSDDGKTLEGPHWLARTALETGTKLGRGGLGSIYVWAAGNGADNGDNCNYDGYASSRFTIAVGAVDTYGRKTYYSEECAALVVTAPSSSASARIYTTDLTGRTGSTAGDCNDKFGGTSAACPMIAGVVALVLQARPTLGWRDVQNVLIRSAKMTDSHDSDWVTNGAGLQVNHKYGFGLADANAAVSLAQNISLLALDSSSRFDSDGASLDIPDSGTLRVERTVVDEMTLEHVELVLSCKHERRGQLRITLISPSGTRSILADKRDDTASDYAAWTFTTVRCWGEDSQGDWVLTIEDTSKGYTGRLTSWSLILHGVRQ